MGNILGIAFMIAWVTHVFHCFAQEAWGLLIAGALVFPIAIVNGIYIWFT
jgi:hypothetical protein